MIKEMIKAEVIGFLQGIFSENYNVDITVTADTKIQNLENVYLLDSLDMVDIESDLSSFIDERYACCISADFRNFSTIGEVAESIARQVADKIQ